MLGGAEVSVVPYNNLLPNWILIDYDVTATSVFDSVDKVSATVTAGNQTKSFSLTKVAPGVTTHTVYINMLKCYEDINVYTVAEDGGDSIGSSNTPGKRYLASNLLNLWHPGSFSSASASLDSHFSSHHSELGITNIESYVNSAQSFRYNLSGATSSPVYGPTPNVTIWKKNGKYIDICGSKNTGLIISYGRQ